MLFVAMEKVIFFFAHCKTKRPKKKLTHGPGLLGAFHEVMDLFICAFPELIRAPYAGSLGDPAPEFHLFRIETHDFTVLSIWEKYHISKWPERSMGHDQFYRSTFSLSINNEERTNSTTDRAQRNSNTARVESEQV
ncbi:hypothetical protein YC2023_092285 [Brassica napus]